MTAVDDEGRWFEAEHWAGHPTMPDAERPVEDDDEEERER